MRILANENVPRVAIEALRKNGHDVLWARTDMAGADDVAILYKARTDSRVVVTFDKDFGEFGVPPGNAGIMRRGSVSICVVFSRVRR